MRILHGVNFGGKVELLIGLSMFWILTAGTALYGIYRLRKFLNGK